MIFPAENHFTNAVSRRTRQWLPLAACASVQEIFNFGLFHIVIESCHPNEYLGAQLVLPRTSCAGSYMSNLGLRPCVFATRVWIGIRIIVQGTENSETTIRINFQW